MKAIISQQTVLGLMWAASGRDDLPARSAALDAGIEALSDRLAPASSARAAVDSFITDEPGPDGRVAGVPAILRAIVAARSATTEGTGWGATYRANESWLAHHQELLAQLPAADRAAFAAAGQAVVALATMVSKKRAA